MPAFQDLKTSLALSDSKKKVSNFRDYAEASHEYSASGEPATEAFERAYFADKDFKDDRAIISTADSDIVELESALIPVLARMESVGVFVSREGLADIAEALKKRAKTLELEMLDLVGEPFNPNSAKQVQYVLFEKLGIPAGKKIKTGFSVDSDTLEEIGKNYAIANLILEYRTCEKLRSTYAEGLAKEIGEDGRIHTTYNQI